MRRLTLLACGLVVAALIAPTPAQAIPFERPVFLAPLDGEAVSGRLDIRVSSQAPYVRLSMRPANDFSKFVKVVDGVAEGSFGTLGFYGRTAVQARSCTDTTPRSCGSDRTIDVMIDTPVPSITSPRDGDDLYPSEDVLVTVALEAGGVDLVAPGFGDLEPDTEAPYEFLLDRDRLKRGRQTWEAIACNVTGTKCDGARSRVEVRVHRPGLSIIGGERVRVSPNGDGTADTGRVLFRVQEQSSVTLQVRDGQTVLRSFDLGDIPADDSQRVDILGDIGGLLPDGEYQLRYRAALLADPEVQEVVESKLYVDTKAPVVLDKNLPYSTFYPYRDRYRDTVRPTVRMNERLGTRKVTIRNEVGEIVYLSGARELGQAEPFTYGFWWEGRDSGPLPPGTYRIDWSLVDLVGNEASATQWVAIDDDLVVERDVTLRVKASEATEWKVGSCSAVRKDPKAAGGRLLLSDEKCDSSPYENRKHIVAAYYRVTIPKSLRPQRLSLEFFGGAVEPRSYLGTSVWKDSKDKWDYVNWSGPAMEMHTLLTNGEREIADTLVGQKLYWVSFVNRGMQYRIRDFRIETTKAFLVEPAVPAPAPATRAS